MIVFKTSNHLIWNLGGVNDYLIISPSHFETERSSQKLWRYISKQYRMANSAKDQSVLHFKCNIKIAELLHSVKLEVCGRPWFTRQRIAIGEPKILYNIQCTHYNGLYCFFLYEIVNELFFSICNVSKVRFTRSKSCTRPYGSNRVFPWTFKEATLTIICIDQTCIFCRQCF